MKEWIFVIIILFLSSGVFAISGISPGSHEINFEPGLEAEVSFNFIFDSGVRAQLYVEGALADYVTLDKKELIGGGVVVAKLSLPNTIDPPGLNLIRIGARQVGEEEGGVGVVSEVRGIIKINVPYPGKYVGLELKVPSANAGEIVNMSLKASNLGKENVEIAPLIQIFQGDNKIETINLKSDKIVPFGSMVFEILLNTSDYSAGDYNVTALAEYDEGIFSRRDSSFRLGELSVKIVNYSREFKQGEIERFEIEVESFWNNMIEEIYAEVNILGTGISFMTPTSELKSWRKITLVGFLDTSEINSEIFQAEIILHYNGKVTSEVVNVRMILKPSYVFWWVLVVVLIVAGLLGWRVLKFLSHIGVGVKKNKDLKK